MPTNPATKSQVQAYRFSLRRMESALVRKDSVMLHEPMRTHLRSAVVGVILGALGLAGFFVYGFLNQADDLSDSQIVVGKESGAIFVVQPDPLRLIPVYNLASARLLLAGLGGPGAGTAPEASLVEESTLADAPRAPLTGLQGAPATLPGPDERPSNDWSACDTAIVNTALPDAESQPDISSTALVGVPRPGRELADDEALLVTDSAGNAYLVSNGKRGRINPDIPAVNEAYGLADITPRQVSTGLLNAIPEGDSLNPPAVAGAGEDSQFGQLSGQGEQVGDVVRVIRAGQESFFLILRDGKQQVERAVADLIRFDRSATEDFANVAPEDIAEVPDAPPSSQEDFSDYPAQPPDVLEITETPVACSAWDGQESGTISITVSGDDRLPLPEGMRAVQVPGADGAGDNVDRVFLPPGQAALVRGVVPGQDPDTGSIFLVTDQGLRYGVPSLQIANTLGLGQQTQPAPEAILGLLPIGPSLDPQDALELFDPELAREQQEQQLSGGG